MEGMIVFVVTIVGEEMIFVKAVFLSSYDIRYFYRAINRNMF